MKRVISAKASEDVVTADMATMEGDRFIFYVTRHDIAVLKHSPNVGGGWGFEYAGFLLHRSVGASTPSSGRCLAFSGKNATDAIERALKAGRKVFATDSIRELATYAYENMEQAPE